MSLPHCVSSAALDIEHGREGGHFALQKRPHNLVPPNAVAHIATSQKGLACTPRDPKCGRFFCVFLDFGQISPPAIFGQPWPQGGEGGRGGGGRGVQPAQPRLAAARNTPSTFFQFCYLCSIMPYIPSILLNHLTGKHGEDSSGMSTPKQLHSCLPPIMAFSQAEGSTRRRLWKG